jgi:RHS repeat-associated protein
VLSDLAQQRDRLDTLSYWFIHDQVGSTLALLNSADAIAGSYSYTHFGVATYSGTVTTPLQYTGQYADSVPGLVYLRARYDDPRAALFLTVDPKLGATDIPYPYTDDDPLNYTDLTRLCWSGFAWACTAAKFVFRNAGNIATGPGAAGIAVSLVVCSGCDFVAIGIGVAAEGLSVYRTGAN